MELTVKTDKMDDGQDGVDGLDGDKGFDGNSAKWTFQYDNNFPIDINDPLYIDGDFITIAAGAVTNDKSAVEKIHIKNIDSQLPIGTDMTNWLSSTQLQVGDIISIRHTIESQQVGYYTVSAAPIQMVLEQKLTSNILESDTTPFDPLSQYFVGYVKTVVLMVLTVKMVRSDGVDGADGDKGFDGNSSKWTYVTGVWNDPITNTNYPDGNFFTENTNTGTVTSVKSDVNRIKLRNLDALVPPTNLINWMGPLQLEVGDIITIRHTVNSQEVGYYRVSSTPLHVPPVGSAGTVIDVVHIESDVNSFNPTEDYFVGYVKTVTWK